LFSIFLFLINLPCFANDKIWPTHTKVGYLENLNYNTQGERITPKYDIAYNNNYDIIVIAFADIQDSKVSFYNNGNNNDGYAPYQNDKAFLEGVDYFHKLKPDNKILVSVGGENSSLWNPCEDTEILAENIILFLKTNHLDGIDFNLEGNINARTTYLTQLITKLRQKAQKTPQDFPRGFFVTAAPQITGNTGYFCWPGNDNEGSRITELMKIKTDGRSCFDALFIQNYNPGVKPITDELFKKIKNQGVPADTNILFGMPAAPAAAGAGYVEPSILKSQLSKIQDPQFGGLMVWAIPWDCGSNWAFSNGLKEEFIR
jgi:chitinase